MTDPSTPVPSDEAVEAAAAHMTRDDLDAFRLRDEKYTAPFRKVAAAIVTAAYAIDAPRLRAEAAAEARAATLREVIEMFQALQPWERNASGTFTGAEAAALVKRMLNPEANDDT